MKYAFSLFALFSFFIASAQINFVSEEWMKAKKQAQAENKIVFVDAYTTWCGPCKWMAKNVFTDPGVGEFFNENFVNLKLDMEKGEGLQFAQEYQVNAYPTLLFLAGDGTLLHKHLGAIPADQFLMVGQDAMSPEKRIGSYIEKYQSEKDDPEFLREYLVKMLGAGIRVDDAANHYFSILEKDEIVTEDNLLILQMLIPAMESEAFKALLMNRNEFRALGGEEIVDGLVETVLASEIYGAVMSKDEQEYQRVRQIISQMNVPEKDMILVQGDMEFYDMQGNTDAYLKNADTYTKTYAWNDWNELNNIAWDMYLNSSLDASDMKLARKLAKRAVKLEANYYTTDTYAAVLHKAGKNKKALPWAKEAVRLAKEAGEDTSGTDALIEKIKAEME